VERYVGGVDNRGFLPAFFVRLRIAGFFDFYLQRMDAWLYVDIAVCLNDWCTHLASGEADGALPGIAVSLPVEYSHSSLLSASCWAPWYALLRCALAVAPVGPAPAARGQPSAARDLATSNGCSQPGGTAATVLGCVVDLFRPLSAPPHETRIVPHALGLASAATGMKTSWRQPLALAGLFSSLWPPYRCSA